MGLQKKIFNPKPNRKITKKELDRRELAWKMLCENGSVCINDPLRPIEKVTDDSYIVTGPFCDYYDCNGNKRSD